MKNKFWQELVLVRGLIVKLGRIEDNCVTFIVNDHLYDYGWITVEKTNNEFVMVSRYFDTGCSISDWLIGLSEDILQLCRENPPM